jgi:hypothetical protein
MLHTFNFEVVLPSSWYGHQPPFLMNSYWWMMVGAPRPVVHDNNVILSCVYVCRHGSFFLTQLCIVHRHPEGTLLAHGKPTGVLPALRERKMNYQIAQGSKYAVEAEKVARGVAAE